MRLFLALLFVLGSITLFLAWKIWTFDAVYDRFQADAAIVLGATTRGNKPSPILRARIDHAIALYRRGRVARLILTGAASEGEILSNAEAARLYALENGVPEENIFVESYSETTLANLIHAKHIATINGIRTVTIVSDPLHLWRAMRMAKDVGLDAIPSSTPLTCYTHWKRRFRFLCHEAPVSLRYLLLDRFVALDTELRATSDQLTRVQPLTVNGVSLSGRQNTRKL